MSVYRKLRNAFHRNSTPVTGVIRKDGTFYLKIECRAGTEVYEAIVTGEDMQGFPPLKNGASGEKYLAELIESIDGTVLKVERRNKDGKLSDGPHGQLALQEYKDGELVKAASFKDGKPVRVATAQKSVETPTP